MSDYSRFNLESNTAQNIALEKIALYFMDARDLIADQKQYARVIKRATTWTMIATIVMAVAILIQCGIMAYTAFRPTASTQVSQTVQASPIHPVAKAP